MDANANHDIHNRSRNRKQERLWWKRAAAEPPHPPPPMTSRDDCDHGRLTASLRALCVARHLVETPGGTAQRRGVLRDLDGMLSAWSESLLPGSPSYADNLADPTPNPDRSQAPCLLSFGSYRLGVNAPDADIDCLVLAPPHVTRDDLFGSWVVNATTRSAHLCGIDSRLRRPKQFKIQTSVLRFFRSDSASVPLVPLSSRHVAGRVEEGTASYRVAPRLQVNHNVLDSCCCEYKNDT